MNKCALAAILAALASSAAAAPTAEQDFLAANRVAMSRMMDGMSAKPAGDIDADFVNMMEPHHQGAIDMAMLELRYGKNQQLRRIAQGIVAEQRPEIDAMRLALGRPLTTATSAASKAP